MAAVQTDTIDVSGNCGTCKKKIEKAVMSVRGVEEASWDKKTKKLTVTFNDARATRDAIVEAVLAVGYDADGKKANDEAYENLAACCHYRD
jgi:copper chaperone CopZ